MAQETQVPDASLLRSFAPLFYACKVLGINPHSLQAFRSHGALHVSQMGAGLVILAMLAVSAGYVWMIDSFEDTEFRSTQNNLNVIIGVALNYIGLAMMIVDQLTAIRNQRSMGAIFASVETVDAGLQQLEIAVANRAIKLRVRILMALAVAFEVVLTVASALLGGDFCDWLPLLWLFASVPTLYNTLDKIWFVGLLLALRQRFRAMNAALDEIVARHERHAQRPAKLYTISAERLYKRNFDLENNIRLGSGQNRVTPIVSTKNYFGEFVEEPKKLQNVEPPGSELLDVVRIEEKFVQICQLHDTICSIAKSLNELWSYPMLILMAYGFVMVTAQMYFYYCARTEQLIPSLFNSAKSTVVTAVYLTYIAGKCIALMFLSWKTSLESKRTGICLHRCAVAANTNEVYEIVNHLSLKLLNQDLDFSACGFFSLDMETLYAVIGGITSYLIILVQFNMAGQQVKNTSSPSISMGANGTLAMAALTGNATNYLSYLFFMRRESFF